MTLINLLIAMLVFIVITVAFLAFLFAGFQMGRITQGKTPQINVPAPKKTHPIPPIEMQEDPYLRALRPIPPAEVRIPTIKED